MSHATGVPRPLSGAETGTRARVARLILEKGPITASALGERLGLTPAAIRRHLDNLTVEGMIEARDARPHGGRRRRGRPARVFVITEAGRDAFVHAYDDLASSALRFLEETGGPEAVGEFARSQVAELEERYKPLLDAVPSAGPSSFQRRLRRHRGSSARSRGRRTALPAPLPRRARGRRVPAAL